MSRKFCRRENFAFLSRNILWAASSEKPSAPPCLSLSWPTAEGPGKNLSTLPPFTGTTGRFPGRWGRRWWPRPPESRSTAGGKTCWETASSVVISSALKRWLESPSCWSWAPGAAGPDWCACPRNCKANNTCWAAGQDLEIYPFSLPKPQEIGLKSK